MTKQSNKNGFAQDLNRVFTLSDRTHKSTLQYFINKFLNDFHIAIMIYADFSYDKNF